MQRVLMVVVAMLVFAPAAEAHRKADDVRFATFNASLNRPAAGDLVNHLSHPEVDDVFRRQARNVAEVIQRARPDVLLINEFDFDPAAADLFRDNFLEVSQNGAAPITYPYAFIAPSNTGIPSGKDLDNNGSDRRRQRRVRLRRVPGPVRTWWSSPSIRSTPAPCGRSRTSAGRTCPAT